MKVIGSDKLASFGLKHANARNSVDAWLEVVERADWKTPHDIKARFPTVDFITGNKVIFNLKGNHYRLFAKIGYNTGNVTIEWIGTHAEYDRLIR